MRSMFDDVVAALDSLALAGAWCNVISTDGLDAFGQLASPSWSHDGRLVLELGWAGTPIAEVVFNPCEFRAALIRGDELGVFETNRAVLVGPVDEPENPWAVPACHEHALVFGGGDALTRFVGSARPAG
jgi:hypothetical protein